MADQTPSDPGTSETKADLDVIKGKVKLPSTILQVYAFICLILNLLVILLGVGLMIGFFANGDDDLLPGALVYLAIGVVGCLLWLTVLVGANRMGKLRAYSFAIIAAVLSMLPLSFCCLVGFPLGLWNLVVLFNKDVRANFS